MKKFLPFLLLAAAGLAAWLLMPETVPTGERRADGLYFGKMSTEQMRRAFKAQNYAMVDTLEDKKPVPRIFVAAGPKDFNRSKYDEERPALFTEMLTPVIFKANEAVLRERARIEELKKKFDEKRPLSVEDLSLLENTAEKYDVDFDTEDLSTFFANLLPRIDAVPPSLLLAMAAEDSGFATDRYAREYNSIFLRRDWDGNGVLPEEATRSGDTYRIRVYPTLYDAVSDQILWLNSLKRFMNFHAARASFRFSGNDLYGADLTKFFRLFPYRDFKYPDVLKHLIKQYGWTVLDLAAFSN